MSKWSDFMAKLTRKASPAVPPDSPSAPETPPEVTPEATPTTPQAESSDSAMQQTTPDPHNTGEPVHPAVDLEPGRPRRRTQTDSASRLYARALIEMGEAGGTLDELASEVAQLDELFREEAGRSLEQLFSTPALGETDRRDMVDRVFKGRVSDTLYRFMQVVNRKDRLGALPGILAAFDQLLDEKRGIVEVDVHVAQRLDAADAEAVAARLRQALGKQIVLHQYVDESLIGGLIIRVGDRLIDGSVATQLKTMRKNLVEAGRTKARQSTAIQEE